MKPFIRCFHGVFAYVQNNPVNFIDPSGTSAISLLWAARNWYVYFRNEKDLLKIAAYKTDFESKGWDAFCKGKTGEAEIYLEAAKGMNQIYLDRLAELGLKAPNTLSGAGGFLLP